MGQKGIVIILLLSIIITACNASSHDEWNVSHEDGLKRTLTIELVKRMGGPESRLHQRILQFADKRSDIELNIRTSNNSYKEISPWILGKKGIGEPPDIVE